MDKSADKQKSDKPNLIHIISKSNAPTEWRAVDDNDNLIAVFYHSDMAFSFQTAMNTGSITAFEGLRNALRKAGVQ